MSEKLELFDKVIESSEEHLKTAEAVVESLNNVVVSHNTVIMLESSKFDSAYLHILEGDATTGSVQFNFTANIATTPRYTPERAHKIAKAFSTEERPLKTGNLLACAKADVEMLKENLEGLYEAREKL
ncbi:hypothetical protein [Vibrio crassostreae]|uniref:hypothetical protein n=1 Tax=Vibrio crassostreae TaxID=246167 RepID=UPI001B306B19|nr:hypothetical protein [Vibrio crassostreae]